MSFLQHKSFSNFSCMFLNPNYFFPVWIIIVLRFEKPPVNSVTRNCSDLWLFEQIIQVISKNLQILGRQPQISKVFFRSLVHFFLTVGQNNFGNKIPLSRCNATWLHGSSGFPGRYISFAKVITDNLPML